MSSLLLKGLLVVSTLLVIKGCSPPQKWPHLVTTFPGLHSFINAKSNEAQPRTLAELQRQGWVRISRCADNHPNFPGERYIRSYDDKDIVIILDDKGFIAGMQSVVMKEYTKNDQYYKFSNNPYYIASDWNGEEAYFVTAYFVDTSIICRGGRTTEEWKRDGTGSRLAFQNGPTNRDLMEIPLKKNEMCASDEWYGHLCVLGMGEHFLQIPPDAGNDFNCTSGTPLFQILYSGGALTGFVFTHFAEIPSMASLRYENPHYNILGGPGPDPMPAIPLIVDKPPQCMLDRANQGILRTMHVWFGDYFLVTCPLTTCPLCVESWNPKECWGLF